MGNVQSIRNLTQNLGKRKSVSVQRDRPKLVLNNMDSNYSNDGTSTPMSDHEESVDESPLTAHFRKQTAKFESQTLDIMDRLTATFHEKQAIARGQMTESLRRDHIKQRSIMSNGSSHVKAQNGKISVMDQIAKMVSRELRDRDSRESVDEEEEDTQQSRSERRKSKKLKRKKRKEKEKRKKKRRSSKREKERFDMDFMPPIVNV